MPHASLVGRKQGAWRYASAVGVTPDPYSGAAAPEFWTAG